MIQSMTGFAAGQGNAQGYSWSWELRSVNAKGLDLRLRVPDWIDGLEPALRAILAKSLGRGSVSLSLRVTREESATTAQINQDVLAQMLGAIAQIEQQAAAAGVDLVPARASDLLNQRGVLEQATDEGDTKALSKALQDSFGPLVTAFLEMRAREGQSLQKILDDQLTEIADLVTQAMNVLEDRRADMAQALRDSLARVLENSDGIDEQRLTQELALIAVKSDVTEEIDRLRAHVDAARELLQETKPVGRKMDFLMQEFNREANTLCSKSQSSGLTRIGLELKTVIDQMREQVQNVE